MFCLYCRKCLKGNDTFINCAICNRSIHSKCSDESRTLSSANWYCKHCIGSIFPFNHIIDNDEFIHEVKQINNDQTIDFNDLIKLNINPFNLNDDNDKEPDENVGINNPVDQCNYYCSDTFNDRTKHLSNSKFSLIHFNSRILNKNIDNITNYLKTLTHKFSIIAFSESWLNDSNTLPSLINIDGYNIAYYNRRDKRGGGVALYVSDDLKFKVCDDLNLAPSQDYESLFVEIESEPKNVIIGVIYRARD